MRDMINAWLHLSIFSCTQIRDYPHELEVMLTRATLCQKSSEVHEVPILDCNQYHHPWLTFK